MIRDVAFDVSPLAPGASRSMVVDSTRSLAIEIMCFTNNPPPPGYKPCSECGTIRAQSGQKVTITANRQLFASGGVLEVTVTDDDGDRRHYAINVASRSSGSAALASSS